MSSILKYTTDTATVQRRRIAQKQLTSAGAGIARIHWATLEQKYRRQQKEHDEKCPETGVCTLHEWNSDY